MQGNKHWSGLRFLKTPLNGQVRVVTNDGIDYAFAITIMQSASSGTRFVTRTIFKANMGLVFNSMRKQES